MEKLRLYILITIVITLCLQFGCSTVDATDQMARTSVLLPTASEFDQAEALFAQREDPSKLRDAISILGKYRGPEKRFFEVEWKFAKYNYFLGKLSVDADETEAAFTIGRDAGKIASELDPNKPDGHFWYGANLGELARINMITVGIPSIGTIKETMYKVIEIQPTYQNSSAYDVLAQVELETRLYGGKPEKAVELLETALKAERENMNLHLNLAKAYLAVNRDGDAKKELDKLISMKPDPAYMPEYRICVEAAKKLLATKF